MNIRMTIQNENSTTPWQFTGYSLNIGRNAQCELPLANNPAVSGRHAKLEYAGQHWMLSDAGSRNGTYLNGRLVHGSQSIRPGDVIRLGPSGPLLNIEDVRQPFAMQGPSGRVHSSPLPNAAPAIPIASSPSPTRIMLRRVLSQQKRNRLLRVIACLIVVAAASTFLIFGRLESSSAPKSDVSVAKVEDKDKTPTIPSEDKQPQTPPKVDPAPVEPDPVDDSPSKEQIFNQAVRHAVFIANPKGTGSGSVFNMGRRLILTNYHVVGQYNQVRIFFPKYDADGQLIRDLKQYVQNKWYTVGNVLIREPSKDIAVVQVDAIPAGSHAITFAAKSVKATQRIHLVGGSPMGSGNAMWSYDKGRVSSVNNERLPISDHNGKLSHIVVGHIVRSTMRSHPGTSGAGVVNDDGEFVALNFAGRMRGNRAHLDVRDVRQYLQEKGYMD